MVIDFHAHLGRGAVGATDRLQRDLTAEMIVGPAREAGIGRTVVFPVTYEAGRYREANEGIAAAVGRYPDELIGFARTVVGAQAEADLEHAVRTLGLHGLKLHHGCDGFDPAGPATRRIVGLAGELGVPVIFHSIGIVEVLGELAAACPQTPIVLGHMGGLWDWQAAERATDLAEGLHNVWLETSALLVTFAIEEAAARVGGKVLFGSDAPAIHPAVELAKITTARMTDDTRAAVLGGNAARLLGLGGP